MTTKKYSLTKEHEKELAPWADKWIKNAMSTKPMDEEEKEICRKAVKEMYTAANLTPPPDHRIIFVPSPFVLRFASGFAAAIWYMRNNKGFRPNDATRAATREATYDATFAATREATFAATDDATFAATDAATDAATREATYDATFAATREATYDATRAATFAATYDATDAATYAATYAATRDATDAATYAATREATYDATFAATDDATFAATREATYDATREATFAATDDATFAATDDATFAATREANKGNDNWYKLDTAGILKLSIQLNLGKFGLMCAQRAWSFYQGGNQWSGWTAFLSFFRHVAKLDIDYSKFDSVEKLAMHGGPRMVHKEFCMISDRPLFIKVNERNQPHCYDGPYCQWSDGTALYMMNGVKVPQWVAEAPKEKFTKEMIIGEKNADVRREIIRKIGMERVAELLDYKVIDRNHGYELITFDIGDGRVRPFLKMQNPSMDLVHIEGVRPEVSTVEQAICYRNNLTKFELPLAIS